MRIKINLKKFSRRRNSQDYTPERSYREHTPDNRSFTNRESLSTDERCETPKLRPILKRPPEVISYRVRTPPPIYECVVERVPTPEPDVVQRVRKKWELVDLFSNLIITCLFKDHCQTTTTSLHR